MLSSMSKTYSTGAILRWLWKSWKGNRLQAFLNAAIGVMQVAASLSMVWTVKYAIDIASHTAEGNLLIAIGIMGTLILFEFLLNISSVWVRNILGVKAQNRMQRQMLSRILRSEWHGQPA